MVTSNVSASETFTLEIHRIAGGNIVVVVRNKYGQTKSYSFPERKLRVYSALDAPVKEAVGFLLGEA